MNLPRIVVTLPTFGPHAGPEGVATIARATEDLGFHGVAASERLLMPAGPDWTNDMGLPEAHVWDVIEMLTWAAAHTRRIRLCTAVVNALFQPPIVLARRLATLDQLSRGRLDVGIGQGGGGGPATSFCMPEEFVAAGVSRSLRGAGYVEYLAAMRACWAPDPVSFHGANYRIPLANVGPKPHGSKIPLFLAGLTRVAIERAAKIGDGFMPPIFDWDLARTHIGWYRDAGGTGTISAKPMPSAQNFVESALRTLDQCASLGVDEVHFELNLAGIQPGRQVALLEELHKQLK
jgi:alkanesulfonate monooxygenase SsuD/methylene tetrahydromethanopterin reductase-like flavin-dependent oxidoreductase (luciferase family)